VGAVFILQKKSSPRERPTTRAASTASLAASPWILCYIAMVLTRKSTVKVVMEKDSVHKATVLAKVEEY